MRYVSCCFFVYFHCEIHCEKYWPECLLREKRRDNTIQVDDVIPILPPSVGWMVAATLVPQESWNIVRKLSHAWW